MIEEFEEQGGRTEVIREMIELIITEQSGAGIIGELAATEGGRVALAIVGVFFFFQAEDGIRDLIVTGVQTCAFPISFVKMPFTPLRRGYSVACWTVDDPEAAALLHQSGVNGIFTNVPALMRRRWPAPP